MKRLSGLFAVVILFLMASCGPSAEERAAEQARLDSIAEAEAQAILDSIAREEAYGDEGIRADAPAGTKKEEARPELRAAPKEEKTPEFQAAKEAEEEETVTRRRRTDEERDEEEPVTRRRRD